MPTPRPSPRTLLPTIRRLDAGAPLRWLRAGFADLRRCGAASLFYGLCFAAAGWLMVFVFANHYALFVGLATGFLLLGPILAMGLYELSRRLERGEPPRLAPSLTAWRPNLANIGLFAAVLAVVLLIWARASVVIFAVFYSGGLPTFGGVLRAVFAFEQPEFAVVYFVVGGFFAALVFAIAVVAVPAMLDRGTDAISAGLASLAACARNPVPLLLWAAIIAALTALGFATLFAGLVVTMPLVGHATWHAYRDLIAADG